jgi:hypothetical protein
MANEQTTGAPLAAPLAEQLREKERLDEARTAERAADAAVERHVEKKKAEEREVAVRHARAASPEAAAREVRRAGRLASREGHARWPILAGGLALLGVLVALRRVLGRR